MATVRKRSWKSKEDTKTAWIADYTDQDGKRRFATFDTKREAEDWLAETKIEVKRGVHTPASQSITVAEAGDRWIAQAELDGLEYATVREYRRHLEAHIKPILGSLKLSALTVASVKDFRNRLIRDGRSSPMAKKIVSSLGSILADAMEDHKVAHNVVHEQSKGRRRRLRRVEGRQKRKLEELRALLTIQGRWRAFIHTAIFTGLRASELRGLPWDNVDLEERTLWVRQRADCRKTIGAPKSEAGKREITFPPIVANTLREWRLACPKSEAGLVFPTDHGTVWDLTNLYRSLNPAQRAAGLAKSYGLHALRHAAASLFIAEGYSPKEVQAIMGHSVVGVTFDTYGHLFKPDKEDTRLDRLQARLVG
jgi:integrase